MTVAALFAAAGAWLGWRWAAGLPADVEARSLAMSAAPGLSVAEVDRLEPVFSYQFSTGPATRILGSDNYNGGYVLCTMDTPDGSYGSVLTGVEANLRQQGWKVTPTSPGRELTATRADLALFVLPVSDGAVLPELTPEAQLGMEFVRPEPAAVLPLTVVGWLVGLLLGGLVVLAGAGRLSGRGASGPAAAALAGVGSLLLLPATVLSSGDVIYLQLINSAMVSPPATWSAYTYILIRPLSMLGVAVLATALVLLLLPRRRAQWARGS
ncbi:hypothetical protein Ais01nite_49190 [Asanoa ishikariensis]|uniref:Uncharacterized protein n=1 Tax=Asanoa ishikariensis TaxID=137265 RepID=A0A1H3RS53_9ACTN|nr:hypothetical protein [Asanoa ishikariensis]GIF66884.1 hypothetical protein Ais01nite_49190 [Asanoa ishikariensis]SDZ28604.1 hypothetical protein SAMN05421684_4162 [Asanoa ishikariensis]